MTIVCNNCGTSFPDHAAFCPRCGKPQSIAGATSQSQIKPNGTDTPVQSTTPPLGSAEQPAETGRRKWTLGRALGGCLLAFICVVAIFAAIGSVAAYQGLQERAALTRQEATVHYQRGLDHMNASQYELAIAEFEHTLRLDPTHREAREALREVKTVALTQPTPTSATLNEATIAILAEAEALAQEEKWEEVSQRLSQLRDLSPEFESQRVSDLLYTANLNLGMQHLGQGQANEAVHAFEQALGERPGDPQASRQLDLASLYVSAEATWEADWPSAIDFLEQLHTLDADYLDVSAKLYQAYEAYGDVLVEEEAWCLAELQYEQATLLKPSAEVQTKWEEAVRLCRMPTPTPGPTRTPTLRISPTASITATTEITRTTPAATGSILFSRFNDKAAVWEILAVSPDKGTPVAILDNATQPATSPNGQLLAYHAEVDEAEGLHVYNVRTKENTRITTFREDVTPDWAPDNQRFIFPSQRSGDRRWQIYVGWADGKGEPVALIEGRTPAWSPTGDLIAYQGTDAQGNNPGLYLISAEGGPIARLTQDESDRAPAWSPTCTRSSIQVTNDGISVTPTTTSSNAGCLVAFMSSRNGNWEIYTIDAISGSLKRLTTAAGNDGLPTWSPDGRQIAFVSDRDGSWGVYTIPANGGEAVKVADWGEAHIDWLVERLAWTR